VGKIVAAPNLLAEDLVKAGLEPSRSLDVALGRVTLGDAVQAQHAGAVRSAGADENALQAIQAKAAQIQQAGAQAAGARGYTWIADGRPLAQYPHAPGERFYARPINRPLTPEETPSFIGKGEPDPLGRPALGYMVRLGDQTNAVKAYGVGPTVEEALKAAKGLSSTPAELPKANVTESATALSASPLNTPADPEFSGWLGPLRRFHSDLFTDRFARVRPIDPNLAGHMGNQAASDLHAGYQSLIFQRLSGVEKMEEADASLVGRSVVAREGERMRTRAQALMAEAQSRIAAGEDWQAQLTDAQQKLQAATTQAELQPLSHAELGAIATKPHVRDALAFYDAHVQPYLEDFKVDAGLSAGSLHAAADESPVFSLVPKAGDLAAGGEAVGATVAPTGARTGVSGPLQYRFRVKRTTAALERTGTAAAYETDIRKLTNAWVGEVIPKNAERSTIEYITSAPWATRLEEGSRAAPGQGILEFQKGKVPGSDVQGRFAVPMPVKRAYDDLAARRSLFANESDKNAYYQFMDFWTQLQLAAPVEASSHFWRIASQYSRLPGTTEGIGRALGLFPSLGPKALGLYNIAKVGSDPAEAVDLMRTLARVGALTGRALPEAAHAGLTGGIERSMLGAPREWLFGMPSFGPGLDGVETRIRMAGLKFLREVVEPVVGRASTDQEIRQFVNGWGTYGSQMQPTFLAYLRKSRIASFGSFQLGGALEREMSQMWSPFLPGTSGGTGLPLSLWKNIPKMQQMAMRASVAWRGIIGDMTFRAATTKAVSGYWPWDAPHRDSGHMLDIPIGSIGEGNEQRFVYAKANNVDPGMSRAWRTTGARALVTGAMQGDFWKGVGGALTDYANTAAGVAGPGIRFGFSALTGKAPYLTGQNNLLQEAPTQPTRGQQPLANVTTALQSANPISGQLFTERAAINSLADPLSQSAGLLVNAVSPGWTVGPPRRVWRQQNQAGEEGQLSQFVNERVNRILDAPTSESRNAIRAQAQQAIREAPLSPGEKRQALLNLRRGEVTRRRAQARRAVRAEQ
jgi:hypothetical protein